MVVTHDRLPKLRATVGRLLESPPEALRALLVVDNASGDGTAGYLDGLADPRVTILRQDRNLGGAGGFETGLRAAVARFDPAWIVVMDDDARPAPDALERFQTADLSGWDAVAAAVFYPDGGICEMNRPARNPFWHAGAFLRTVLSGRGGFHLRADAYAGPAQRVDVASFVGLFLSRGAIARNGYPDGGLFVYGDDGLYTLALSRAGGRIGFLPFIRFEHDCQTLSRGGSGRFNPLWKVYYYHRNLLLLYRMAAGWMFWPALCVILPKWLSKARHHGADRRLYLRLLRRAIGDGLRRRIHVPHEDIRKMAKDR